MSTVQRYSAARSDKDEVEVETGYGTIMSTSAGHLLRDQIMRQTGLLRQFRCVELEKDDELQGIVAMNRGRWVLANDENKAGKEEFSKG
ncbi:uncharacterized protein N7515_001150 [Penicillium bovifimosum]|uniref:Uncharacterized protein n=1 Tax=Penicillium bovifimosum TaxID=126998 RepID=A0A9W9HG12_9EURO|nr:uncharacterized protein N7515_001150 [Penicillium bovifimosum]KAJ5146586.1 hypothetical protein N7515_001150 [Penicillium bovifimosum]